jgi:hypothetical protein
LEDLVEKECEPYASPLQALANDRSRFVNIRIGKENWSLFRVFPATAGIDEIMCDLERLVGPIGGGPIPITDIIIGDVRDESGCNITRRIPALVHKRCIAN